MKSAALYVAIYALAACHSTAEMGPCDTVPDFSIFSSDNSAVVLKGLLDRSADEALCKADLWRSSAIDPLMLRGRVWVWVLPRSSSLPVEEQEVFPGGTCDQRGFCAHYQYRNRTCWWAEVVQQSYRCSVEHEPPTAPRGTTSPDAGGVTLPPGTSLGGASAAGDYP